jgi:hypothetical protein
MIKENKMSDNQTTAPEFEIQINISERISVNELVEMITSDIYVDDDAIFEIIKQLELAVGEEDFLKRCFEYFKKEVEEAEMVND